MEDIDDKEDMRPRLIATDVDGTLYRTDHTISDRTRQAFAAAREAGIRVMAISGRQPYSIGSIVRGTALHGPVVGANGAVGFDLSTRELLFEETIGVGVQRRLVELMRADFPNLKVVSVRDGGNLYVAEHGYAGLEDPGADEALWPVSHRFAILDEVLEEPSLKLVLRDDESEPAVLLEQARHHAIAGCHPTTSGAPFLEVGPEAVTKATALQRLCAQWGIERGEVVAFGDNINDVEMLAWAGLGVAMGNAEPLAKSAADEVTERNDDDGVAMVIERLLG